MSASGKVHAQQSKGSQPVVLDPCDVTEVKRWIPKREDHLSIYIHYQRGGSGREAICLPCAAVSLQASLRTDCFFSFVIPEQLPEPVEGDSCHPGDISILQVPRGNTHTPSSRLS